MATIAYGDRISNYFDGELINEAFADAGGDYGGSTFNVNIGGGGVFDATGNWFTGQIDEVAIFDKAIPPARVTAHFLAGKDGAVPSADPPDITEIAVLPNGQVQITWANGGTLQTAPAVPAASWTDVPGASPLTIDAPASGEAYYQVRQ